MKEVFYVSFGIGLFFAIAGYVFAYQMTHIHVLDITNETHELENTLEEAAALVGEGMVSESEARSYQAQIFTHLDEIAKPAPSSKVTGFTKEHHMSLREIITSLETYLEEHGDMLQALEEAAAGNEVSKRKSSGEQLFGAISNGLEDTKDIVTGHIEDV